MKVENDKTSSSLDLVKGLSDSAFVVDRERNIQDFNRPFLKLNRIDPHKARGIKESFCRDHVNMEICENSCIALKCFEAGAAVRFDEVKGKTEGGETLNLIVTAVPIRNQQGEIVSVLEMHRDVTDEARIHEKYKVFLDKEKRAKEELERLVNERTKELRNTQAQLVHSEKMSSLGQMVAGIAHELNNPINFIYGNVETLKEYTQGFQDLLAGMEHLIEGNDGLKGGFDQLKEKHDINFVLGDLGKLVQSIRHGSERAAEIVQGLKTFSRLDQAQLKETDLHQDIDMTLTLLRNKYKNRIEIHREYGDLPPVVCFSGQLNQVFMNLLANAIDAIEKEGDIWVRTRVDGKSVVIETRDSGMGIPKENLSKIFDPFFTSKDVGKGTGLGLSISYSIVEKHGGKIEVESEVGKGSTFRVILPIGGPPEQKDQA